VNSQQQAKIVVLGAGGHGRVVADAARLAGFQVLGFLDPNYPEGTDIASGCTVLGDDDWITRNQDETFCLALGAGPLPGRGLRRGLYVTWSERGFNIPAIVHPRAVVADGVALGAGCQIMAGAVVQTGAELHPDVTVNTRASIDHGCVLHAHVHVAPGAILCGDVSVATGAHIGPGAIVLPGVRIGQEATVKPGAVLKRDLEDGGVAHGSRGRD
jgi:UDP-perosamine 4-acetyltransferase